MTFLTKFRAKALYKYCVFNYGVDTENNNDKKPKLKLTFLKSMGILAKYNHLSAGHYPFNSSYKIIEND